MKCSHCATPMELVREESTSRSVVRWHRCPACGGAHMFSEPSFSTPLLPLGMTRQQNPEFRVAGASYSSAYSGPEWRGPRRTWIR